MYWSNKRLNFSVPTVFQYLCILILILFSLNGCSKVSEELTAKPHYFQSAQLLNIVPQKNYIISRTYVGQIKAKKETNISFEYPGKVSDIFVDVGDEITKGQLLAQQDTQLLSYKKAELQARIKQVEAQTNLNQANLERINNLIKKGFSSKQSLDEVKAENHVLSAQIQGLLATIEIINYQIEQSKLISPFDATIGKRMLSAGEVVNAGSALFLLIEKNHNEITLGVPGELAQNLSLGQILKVKVGNSISNDAKLIAIGKHVNTSSRTVKLRLEFVDNISNDSLNSITTFNGQLVKVMIDQVVNELGFWLPINAITDGIRGQWQVYLAKKIHSKTHERNFRIDAMTVKVVHTHKNAVYITGLDLTDHIIVSQGLHKFVYGQIIKESTSSKKGNL